MHLHIQNDQQKKNLNKGKRDFAQKRKQNMRWEDESERGHILCSVWVSLKKTYKQHGRERIFPDRSGIRDKKMTPYEQAKPVRVRQVLENIKTTNTALPVRLNTIAGFSSSYSSSLSDTFLDLSRIARDVIIIT